MNNVQLIDGIAVCLAPQVYCVGSQVIDYAALNEFAAANNVSAWVEQLPENSPPAHTITELAGRLCYMSFLKRRPGGNAEYVRHIIESQHGSVFEHTVFNFVFECVSRSLTHELIRHRAGMGYSELSQRYVNMQDVRFILPFAKRSWFTEWNRFMSCESTVDGIDHVKANAFKDWLQDRRNDVRRYQRDLDILDMDVPDGLEGTDRLKWKRQAARDGLPNCTETKIYVTANARSLRHFFEQRGSRSAEPEIRLLANAVFDIVEKRAPHLFGDYTRIKLPDGTTELHTENRKI